ncbi:MAG: hypothetical protein WCY49_07035 [Anaerovoracaceae bacterium]
MALLDLYDKEGQVVGQIPEDTEDGDELETALSGETENPDDEGEKDSTVESEEETEKTTEEGSEETTEEEETEPDEEVPDTDDQEAQRLRRLTRRQERELAFLKARLQRLEKNIITEPVEGEEEITPSRIEELQYSINKISEEKGQALEILVETMAQSPQYSDIKEVCSQDNFNDLVSLAAEKIAEDEKRDPVEVALELEADVWQRRNPYAYMYELIKTYHPKYAKTTKEEIEGTADNKTKTKPETKKTIQDAQKHKAPSTIADAGTGTKQGVAGWTAKRIDEMDEMELDKVPADVYEKYMQGELD